jgi:hypothetical protein
MDESNGGREGGYESMNADSNGESQGTRLIVLFGARARNPA